MIYSSKSIDPNINHEQKQLHKYDREDVSKSLKEFRNLEYSFMLDNGYLLFSLNLANDPTNIKQSIEQSIKDSNKQSIKDSIKRTIKDSIKFNISDHVPDLIELSTNSFQQIFSSQISDYVHHILPNNMLPHYPYYMIVCIASKDTLITIHPGYHHVLNHMLNGKMPDNNHRPRLYRMFVESNQIIYFHPYLMYDIISESNNSSTLSYFTWYGVSSSNSVILSEKTGISMEGANMNKIKIIDPWEHWDKFKTNGNFTLLLDQSVMESNMFKENNKLYNEFIKLESVGQGEFIKLNENNMIFRIRPFNDTGFIRLNKPSIYECMIEIVYYFDPNIRILHTNYTTRDIFEVRTGGILSRSCNMLFSSNLYDICNDEAGFEFNLPKIIAFFENIDYNALICKWFPSLKDLEKCLDITKNITTLDTNPNIDTIVDTNINENLKLKIRTIYSINVYKFDRIDDNNISKINMIYSWMKELKLKGGFVLSSFIPTITSNNKSHPGYMIIAGEDIVITQNNETNELVVFQNRFKCLHWKRVKHYHYSNNDYISRLNYNKIPDDPFIETRSNIELFVRSNNTNNNQNNKIDYSEILSIINNI